MEERTACINRIRGVLAEFGLVFAKRTEALRAELTDTIEDAGNVTLARPAHAARGLAKDRRGDGQQECTHLLWAVMTRGTSFDPRHVSTKPSTPCSQTEVLVPATALTGPPNSASATRSKMRTDRSDRWQAVLSGARASCKAVEMKP